MTSRWASLHSKKKKKKEEKKRNPCLRILLWRWHFDQQLCSPGNLLWCPDTCITNEILFLTLPQTGSPLPDHPFPSHNPSGISSQRTHVGAPSVWLSPGHLGHTLLGKRNPSPLPSQPRSLWNCHLCSMLISSQAFLDWGASFMVLTAEIFLFSLNDSSSNVKSPFSYLCFHSCTLQVFTQ